MPHNYLQTCLIYPIPKFQRKNFEYELWVALLKLKLSNGILMSKKFTHFHDELRVTSKVHNFTA